ncbi:hypothetical protein KI688_003889 [Linnemannia hyalina]|uniref:P-loop containing nucleoside triphosphate hydrolase protein n=1 Tax=Linnemannia hyalina TaxID=64524 RepID=A0A9P8BSC4_9FUNG|nr:hypothetical protein KI688_003889 [Linnemannia hyalina]
MNPYSSHSAQDTSYKVLVLGDSGVGKTSLVHILCNNEPQRTPVPTVGCDINVRLHSSTIPTAAATSTARSGIPSLLSSRSTANTTSSTQSSSDLSTSDPTFIEFYDVRSYENLWKWIADYLEASSQGRAAAGGWPSSSNLQGSLNIPLLVVGTKNDMATGVGYSQGKGGSSSGTGMAVGQELVTKYGGEAISVCAVSATEFMPNSSTSIAFNMFFNQIIDPRTSRHGHANSSHHYRPQHQATPSFGSSSSTPSPLPGYTRQPPTPTPEQQYQSHHNHSRSTPSNDTDPTSSSIPIMDFATFTGGSSVTAVNDAAIPPRRAESPTPARPITPTGNSSSTTHSTTKSSLRAQYERNRTVLGQYSSNMGVPTYTSRANSSNNSSRGHTPTGSRS